LAGQGAGYSANPGNYLEKPPNFLQEPVEKGVFLSFSGISGDSKKPYLLRLLQHLYFKGVAKEIVLCFVLKAWGVIVI